MPDHTPGSLDVAPVAEGRELPALLTALKAQLEQFGPDEVVVLSPFGEQSSLVGRFLAREPANREERQLRELLSGERAVAWRSIFKGKGLDAAAVVLTDITPDAAAWADERRLSWNDLLYVEMTRALHLRNCGHRASSFREPLCHLIVVQQDGVGDLCGYVVERSVVRGRQAGAGCEQGAHLAEFLERRAVHDRDYTICREQRGQLLRRNSVAVEALEHRGCY